MFHKFVMIEYTQTILYILCAIHNHCASSFKISKAEYLRLYPTSSSPRKFYGAAKIHKLPNGGNITELPLRPIVSNIGTSSYYLSKYLAQLLSSLRIHR